MPRKSEGRSDMHIPSLANSGTTQRCHSIILMSQCACRGNCKLDACQGAFRMSASSARAGSRAGLQTYDMFMSTLFVNYDVFASRLTRIARLANIWYVYEHIVGKDIIFSQAMQSSTLCICRNRPPQLCANQNPYDSIWLIFGGFCQISSNVAIEK
jgi:hypothetical protein